MKLKSIVMMAMVAILAMAGSSFAADQNTNTGQSTTGDAAFGYLGTNAPFTANTGNPITAGFETDAISGSGTGAGAASIPAQVAYAAGVYTAGAGPDSGYTAEFTNPTGFFSMCGNGGCPVFVQAVITAADGTFSGEPANTDPFNQARFLTGLVGQASDTGISQYFSQRTTHYSLGDADFIDQRLASMVTDVNFGGGVDNFRQFVQVCGLGGCGVGSGDLGAVDAAWLLLNPGGDNGQIEQAVGNNMSGGNGDYGQLFTNTNVVIDGGLQPVPGDGPAVSYVPSNLGVGPGIGTLPQ